MTIEEIEKSEDYLYLYFIDISTPLAVSKDVFYKWLEDNEMLHWAEDDFSLFRTQESGEYSYEDYYQLPISEIQKDVEKYINTIEL